MIIVLLSGFAGSGKDATASILNNYGYKRYAFADALKTQVAAEYEFPLQWCHTQSGKQKLLANGKTVRELLITRGQEIRAEKNNLGYFAEIIAESILDSFCNKIVISDWRLKCELDVFKNFFSISAKIVTVRIQCIGQECLVNDSLTEHDLDDFPFDIIVKNPGSSWEGLEHEISKKMAAYLV